MILVSLQRCECHNLKSLKTCWSNHDIIITYSFVCYFYKVEHAAHYCAKNQVLFFGRASFQDRPSYSVRKAPVCNRMHQHLCAYCQSQTLAAVPLLGHVKIPHTLIGYNCQLSLELIVCLTTVVDVQLSTVSCNYFLSV